MKRYNILLCAALSMAQASIGQTENTASLIHQPVNNETRASALAQKLDIREAAKQQQTQALLSTHFKALEVIFEDRKKEMEDAEHHTTDKELINSRARTAWDAANGKLNKLYAAFLGKLSVLLTQKQIETLKDLMTEGGLQREYHHYLAMFPTLTDVQKEQVMTYMKEAREQAMNAASAENRKEWFIKYRGRANNYLAAAGYDLRKATEALEARRSVLNKK